MATLLEWLRDALAPEFLLERELGSGGMGAVFLAREVSLDRPVAIKVMRPELASAAAVERFQREARILASLNHPNVVPIHRVGEANGLFYIVMDLLGGETLADLLERGPLSSAQALKLGRDLLEGLETSHRHGVIHRDIKPSNVFLVDGRGVLADFGIARLMTGEHPLPIEARRQEGTPGYMAPEQLTGDEVTPLADLYAVGLVLFEAWTGRRYPTLEPPEQVDWSRVPRPVARVLRRAVKLTPEDRWPNARSFRRALWRTRVVPFQVRTLLLTVAGLLAGGVVAYLTFARIKPCLSLCIAVTQIVQRGTPERGWIQDSIEGAVVGALQRYPDVVVWGPEAPRSAMRRPSRSLSGVVQVGRGDTVQVEVRVTGFRPVSLVGPLADWKLLVEDLSARVLGHIFRSPLDSFLPPAVKPKTPAGMNAFANAERLFAQEQWGKAYLAYAEAAAADSTCWLCYWRYVEVGRWLSTTTEDSAERARYREHIADFPPQYQSLIRADTLPLVARFDTLRDLAESRKDFLFGKFRRGDELLHRGPLIGHARREAAESFNDVRLRFPEIKPTWEHLAWLSIADGDQARASEAMGQLMTNGIPKDDPYALRIPALLQVAFAWRFQSTAEAQNVTAAMVKATEQGGVQEIDAGARYLTHFGVPRGALFLGSLTVARPEYERSTLLAQALAYFALGHPDSARTALRQIEAHFADPELAVFGRKLEVARLLFDTDSQEAAREWPAAERALYDQAIHLTTPPRARWGAAWLLVLGARRLGQSANPQQIAQLLQDEPAPRPLRAVLAAGQLAAAGQIPRALAQTEPLRDYLAARAPDPLFRAVLHLLRAEWYEGMGQHANAAAELLWYENSDLEGLPTGNPQPAELDWAFGTQGRWRRVRLLAQTDARSDSLCPLYADVARLWIDGEPAYRARADSARALAAALGCPSAP